MGKVGGAGLFLAGLILIVPGAIIGFGWLDWLVHLIGYIILGTGVVVGITGLIKIFSGNGGGLSDDF